MASNQGDQDGQSDNQSSGQYNEQHDVQYDNDQNYDQNVDQNDDQGNHSNHPADPSESNDPDSNQKFTGCPPFDNEHIYGEKDENLKCLTCKRYNRACKETDIEEGRCTNCRGKLTRSGKEGKQRICLWADPTTTLHFDSYTEAQTHWRLNPNPATTSKFKTAIALPGATRAQANVAAGFPADYQAPRAVPRRTRARRGPAPPAPAPPTALSSTNVPPPTTIQHLYVDNDNVNDDDDYDLNEVYGLTKVREPLVPKCTSSEKLEEDLGEEKAKPRAKRQRRSRVATGGGPGGELGQSLNTDIRAPTGPDDDTAIDDSFFSNPVIDPLLVNDFAASPVIDGPLFNDVAANSTGYSPLPEASEALPEWNPDSLCFSSSSPEDQSRKRKASSSPAHTSKKRKSP